MVLVHGCRTVEELAYGEMIREALPEDELIGDYVREKLVYYPTVTREPFHNKGRITDLMTSGKLFADIGLPSMEVADDRFMLCGSPAMIAEIRTILDARGFAEGNHGEAAHFVIEKAFVEK